MDKSLKIYISGPMSGLPENNYPAFLKAQKALFDAGYKFIINPARLGEKDSWEEYMKRDIQLLCQCDAVALLDGWGDSRGARLEVQIALALGLQVNTLQRWLGLPDCDEWWKVKAGVPYKLVKTPENIQYPVPCPEFGEPQTKNIKIESTPKLRGKSWIESHLENLLSAEGNKNA